MCCGAGKHVDPANDLSLSVWVTDSQRQWRKQRWGNKYNKGDCNILLLWVLVCSIDLRTT